MARLKFYSKENELYSEASKREISGEEVDIVFNKLRRHFKLNLYLSQRSRWNGHFRGHSISVPYKTSFGLLCHEIAHAIDHKKRGKSKHDKKLMRIIGRVVRYCEKRNYWEDEIKKRTEVKIVPEPTKLEIQEKKIERTEKNIENCTKRLRYFTRLYTTKIKKYNRSLSHLKRHYEKIQSSSLHVLS